MYGCTLRQWGMTHFRIFVAAWWAVELRVYLVRGEGAGSLVSSYTQRAGVPSHPSHLSRVVGRGEIWFRICDLALCDWSCRRSRVLKRSGSWWLVLTKEPAPKQVSNDAKGGARSNAELVACSSLWWKMTYHRAT